MPVELANGAATAPADDIPAALRDGYEVHAAALRHGFDVLLLPRQVLTATHPDSGVELSFVHGVPSSSNLAAVTFAQDKHMRREMLARAGLPVPEGEPFTLRRPRLARDFARKVGYPVVVKPNIGDNLVETIAGIADDEGLDQAIDYFRTPEAERPAHSRAAYSLTMLGEPIEEDGRRSAPLSFQFLVERQVPGHLLRFYVRGGRYYAALHLPDGPPRQGQAVRAHTANEPHPTIIEIAERAAATIPGLALAAVDAVVEDLTKPAASQELWIVDLSERPWLLPHVEGDASFASSFAESVLEHHAREQGISLDSQSDLVRMSLSLRGAIDADATAEAVASAANKASVNLTITDTDRVEGTAQGLVEGDKREIAWLFEALLAGCLDGHRAMMVEARHTNRNANEVQAPRGLGGPSV